VGDGQAPTLALGIRNGSIVGDAVLIADSIPCYVASDSITPSSFRAAVLRLSRFST
jgi:hypothetical protein